MRKEALMMGVTGKVAKPSLTLAKLDEGNYECLGSREAVKVDEKCEIK